MELAAPNVIYTLPSNATNGISSFAYTLGIRPQDLFPTCLILFLSIIAVTVAISFLVWFLDYLVCLVGDMISGGQSHSSMNRLAMSKNPIYESNKESSDNHFAGPLEEENKEFHPSSPVTKFSTRFALPLPSASGSERGINSHRPWWRIRSDSFHWSVLHGNLVRILVLFHLPVALFSCYQMSLPSSLIGTGSIVLAALSFVIFSILIPAHLVIRVTFTTTNKLYDETRTLLSLGPLYNHYRHGSQLFASLFFATNIAFGVTIGVGQKSGTAQAIIILVVEVVSALVTSIWLPWGSGASMGLISFLFCVARIVIAVLLLILTQAVRHLSVLST
jgi:Transient receptor potential (TRP) ion channel